MVDELPLSGRSEGEANNESSGSTWVRLDYPEQGDVLEHFHGGTVHSHIGGGVRHGHVHVVEAGTKTQLTIIDRFYALPLGLPEPR